MGLKSCKIIYDALPDDKKQVAIRLLKKYISAKETRLIRTEIKKAPVHWFAKYHFYWGMYIRNVLRDNGMGEKYFGIKNLDDIYVELVEGAVKEN